ncbi:MAG: portal protein, partial [Burkholderiaceae bacterium]
MLELTDGELLAELDDEIEAAEIYFDGDIAEERALALQSYLRRDDGHEEQGRSKTQDRTVFKTVQGLSTKIANIFLSEKTAVEFTPK